ncbi:MAG: aspartyl-tRNA(Asn)/glutamyl-tRNA(Gln) amidotransferase subunit [Blastocatellia bacterium]|jgi:aspartyl-tRNA(Asn)/glutamyl-tRNA(Gln) amidotransferase subunit A|nr:aspartyl-tRNA(Asn)/glutamyl-tRNA(Gln) amidotransferase subunit [Blastocatellia bacterium]
MNFFNTDIETLRSRQSRRETTAREIVELSLDGAEKLNETLNAFLQIDRAGASASAAAIDDAAAGATNASQAALEGIPIAIKDNICVRGLQATCGSRILVGYHPPYDATVIERLKSAGALIVGKTNCDEFAMGSSNENSAYGPVKNPWDTTRVPGGSSGGSAAAVAAGIVPVALGSDTGGSIRQPAGLCGIVGLKPTYGRVSRYGLVAFASSLDQIGVFGQRARDVGRVLSVIAGRDEHDATSADVPVPDYANELSGDLKNARIGVSRDMFGEGLDEEVRVRVQKAIEVYRELGAEIIDVELPRAKSAIAVYYIIATAEASSNLARFDGVRYGFRAEDAANLREMYRKTRDEGFGAEVKRRIMLGTYVLSSGYYDAYYLKAQRVRALIKEDFRKAFETCDAIATPTTPTPAFPIGEKVNDPLAMYLNDIYTVMANLAGIPGISIPCGLTGEGLPIGLQLLGPHWSEPTLLKLSHAYEQAQPFTARPNVRATD